MVVDDVEHLEDHAVGDGDMGHVGLPGLVREVRTEAPKRALRSLLGLRGDEASGLEDPPDGRHRWDDLGVALLEVIPDGLGPGVDAEVQELLSQRDDLVLVAVRSPRRAAMRPSRTCLESTRTLEAVAPEQLVEPAAMHVVGSGQLGNRPTRL